MAAFMVSMIAGLVLCGVAAIFEALPEKIADKILRFFPD